MSVKKFNDAAIIFADEDDIARMFQNMARPDAGQIAQMRRHDAQLERFVLSNPALRAEFEQFARTAAPRSSTAAPDKAPPQTLPALLSRALATTDMKRAPRWVPLSKLPSFPNPLVNFISKKKWENFAPGVPHGDIAHVSTQLHGRTVIDHMARILDERATLVDSATLSFNDGALIDEDYKAGFRIYDYADMRFKVVEDFMGTYIYAWPHRAQSKQALDVKAVSSLPAPARI